MAVLTNKSIASTYKSVLSIGATTESALTTSIQQLTDGLGNSSPLSMSTTQIQFNNDANTFSFPATRGTSGQILKLADANGTLGWVADASGDVTKTDPIALNTIAVWNDNADQLRSDTTMSINASHNISLLQTNSNDDNLNSYNIGGGNISNVTGSRNVGFGKQNLNAVLAGSDNTAMGNGSLEKVTSGNSNTGFGSDALGNSTDGDFNTAVGKGALGDVLTGENNTAVGYNAGANVSTGSDNTYIGKSAGLLDVGSNNIYIGEGSGSSVAAGNNNVILGSNTGNTISTTSNNIIISDGSGNNRLQFGSTGTATFKATTPSPVVSTPIVSIADSVNGVLGGIGALASGGYPLQIWGGTLEFKTGSSSNIATATTKLSISSGGLVQVGDGTSQNTFLTTKSLAGWYSGIKLTRGLGDGSDLNNNNFGMLVSDNGWEVATFTSPSNNVTGKSTKLTISSGGVATFTSSLSNQFIINSTEANGGYIRLQRNGTDLAWIGSAYHTISPVGANTDLAINSLSGNIVFASGSSEKMRISSGGNVGIGTGTATPSKKLEVRRDDGVSNGLHGITDFNRAGGADAQLLIGYYANGSSVTESTIYSANNLPLSLAAGGSQRLTISSGGNVGIGTGSTAPQNNFTIQTATDVRVGIYGGAGYSGIQSVSDDNTVWKSLRLDGSDIEFRIQDVPKLTIESTGNMILSRTTFSSIQAVGCYTDTTANAANMHIFASGSIVRSTSSRKYKKNIQDSTHGINELLKLRSVTYQGTGNRDGKQVLGGLIAEEVHDLGLTEFVQYAEDGTPDALAYGHMISLCVKSIQEQQTIIEDLKARIETLEG